MPRREDPTGAPGPDGAPVTGTRPASADVVIVGGGISGLAAAYESVRRGLRVRVLDAAPRPGGVITTERFDGWVIDGGPDSLLVQKPGALTLCRDLGLEHRLFPTLVPRTAHILRQGRLHPIPEGSFLGFPVSARALATSSLFSVAGRIRMACEIAVPRRDGDADESIAAFVRRRFGAEAVDYLAEPLLAGIHAGDAERLSVRALFPRLIDAERQAGSVLRAFRRSGRPAPAAHGAFVSLPGGIGELVETLARALPPGTLQLDARVTDLQRRGTSGLSVDTAAGALEARAIVLAVPAYAAAALLRRFDTVLAGLCDAVPYASTATVALGFRRAQVSHPMRGSGFVVPRVERRALLAATWVTSKWPERAPADHVLLRGFLGGGRDPRRLDASDAELIRLVRQDLAALLGIQGEPLLTRIFRWTRQSPQYEVGHLQRVAAIAERLAAIPGVFLTGSGFRAIGIPDCISDARATAAAVAEFVAAGRVEKSEVRSQKTGSGT